MKRLESAEMATLFVQSLISMFLSEKIVPDDLPEPLEERLRYHRLYQKAEVAARIRWSESNPNTKDFPGDNYFHVIAENDADLYSLFDPSKIYQITPEKGEEEAVHDILNHPSHPLHWIRGFLVYAAL